MEDLKNNKMFWVLIVVTIFNVGAFLLGKVVIDKAADRVIQKLEKEYSPSPYGPGFDPDRVNPDAFKASKRFFEMRTTGNPQTSPTGVPSTTLQDRIKASDVWREEFEKERGASPEQ